MPVNLDDLDPEDPFELDTNNRPHLFKHDKYGEEDLKDIYYDALFYPANPAGSAEWLMVGQPPGEDPLVVPLAPPNSGDPTKARPIGIYRASGTLLSYYLIDTGQAQHTKRRR
jgi:hypothetical protein